MNDCTKKVSCCFWVNDAMCTLDDIVSCYTKVFSNAKYAEIDPKKINKNGMLEKIQYILTSVDENGKIHPTKTV